MRILVVDNGTTLLQKLEKLIPGTKTIERAERLRNTEGDGYDIVVLSGSSKEQLIGNESDFANEITYIQKAKKPVIGICFGCELIVSAFGGSLQKLVAPVKGIKEIKIIRPDFFNGEDSVSVFENHQWGISSVPANFEVLAQSIDGPEIIKHKKRFLYGMQFHPENFVDQTQGYDLFTSLLSQIK